MNGGYDPVAQHPIFSESNYRTVLAVTMELLCSIFLSMLLVMSIPFIPFVCCSCVYKPIQFFEQAGIPGPKPKPFIGNLNLMRKFGVSLEMYH